MKKINLKNQKGAISLFVMLAMMFFLVLALSAYTLISRRVQTQTMTLTELQSIYKENSSEIINEMYASENEVIPIYNLEQFKLIGSNEYVEVNGKIYKFGANSTESNTDDYCYILKSNIIVNIDEYFSQNIDSMEFLEAKFYNENYKIDKAEYDLYYYKSTNDNNQNAYWKTVVYQNTYNNTGDTEEGLFTLDNITDIKNVSIKNQKSYSILNEITEDYKYAKNEDGTTKGYEFLLMYNTGINENYDIKKYNWWIQSENPLNLDEKELTNEDGTIKTNAEGYETVYVSGGYELKEDGTTYDETKPLKNWGGLVLSNSGKALLDGSTYNDEYWYSVGGTEKLDNSTTTDTTDDGIKGFPETLSSQYYLFIRVDVK